MSVDKYIICEECEVSLWVGQGHHTFYYGDLEVMEALRHFLFRHESDEKSHTLRFINEHFGHFDKVGWRQIIADDYVPSFEPGYDNKKDNMEEGV